MSDWYWRVIALKAAFALTFFVCNVRADDAVKKLPFCDPNSVKDAPGFNDLVIVSTLDGRLTAFSTQNGHKAWDLETQPLLSSNLHQVEATSGEKWVRLVPSLNGSLYSLSEDTIEPLPIDTVQLMSSSFKFSDGRVLVIGGARETTWLGLDASTGKVIYDCGTAGCTNEQETAGAGRDVLVLRRQANTVRALDPRTGNEKWNFSVAEHQMAVSPRECVGARPSMRIPVNVAVALPDGLVTVSGTEGATFSWQRKLDAPVAGMWRFHSGSLQNIDVLREASQTLVTGGVAHQPSLYIGVHDKQIYIQESRFYSKKIDTAISKPLPWKLVTARPQTQIGIKPSTGAPLAVPEVETNALSLFSLYDNNDDHTDDYGYFVYEQETCEQPIQVFEDIFDSPLPNNSDEQTEHHHIHVHISSLWYWWKEVLLIAVSSALLMNLMIWPRFFAPKISTIAPLPTTQEQMVVQMTEWPIEKPISKVPEYSSRFVNDFTVVRLLGKGGFGVVYEAINNIDHCSYAVKIIILPRKESKRERVLREVRALAKLDHEHIVRYFNAWVEEPPPMWRQQRDAVWMRELDGTLAMTEEYTATSPARHKSPLNDVKLDLNNCSEPSKRLRSQSCNDSFSIVFDENAPAHSTPNYLSKSPTKFDITPNSIPKPPISDDDSFIVFENSANQSTAEKTGHISSSRASALEKISQRVKDFDYKSESSVVIKKKKGHARHWSLGNGPTLPGDLGPRMYLFIQMQLCRPDSLHDWLRHNASCNARADKVNTLFSQIVSAVEYVHLAGLIHRDLKPRNILFAQDGRVKVGDFGLVTAMNDTSQDGEPTEVLDTHQRHTYKVGTHLYMSPEQLMGHPYSYKVDIYSLGLILFELLQPFGTEAERIASLLQLREGNYPQHFHTQYPKEMEVLKMMLSTEPGKRPTATGVRARAPLYQHTDDKYHFILPAMVNLSRQSALVGT